MAQFLYCSTCNTLHSRWVTSQETTYFTTANGIIKRVNKETYKFYCPLNRAHKDVKLIALRYTAKEVMRKKLDLFTDKLSAKHKKEYKETAEKKIRYIDLSDMTASDTLRFINDFKSDI